MTIATHTRHFLALALIAVAGLFGACSGEESLGSVENRGGKGGKGSGAGGLPDGGLDFDSAQPGITSLTITPPSATIEVTNGTSTPATFEAMATYANGSQIKVTAEWSFDRVDLGTINMSAGVLTAHNDKGGKGTITAKVGTVTANAEAIVKVHVTQNDVGLSPAQQDAFKNPDATPSGTLLYPYDATVFGRGLLAPEVMWNGGVAGDVYKVSIVDAHVDMTAFVFADQSRWTVPATFWTTLTESSDGTGPVSVTIQRMSGAGQTHQPMAQSWKIAAGNLRGTIYYWAVSQGAIVKINPGAAAPVRAFDPGPFDQVGTPAPVSGYTGKAPPWEKNSEAEGKRCVACHTVSRDGSTLAAMFHAGSNYPWGSVDTKNETIRTISDYGTQSVYGALNPDGKRLVYDTLTFAMHMSDTKTGLPIPSPLDSLTRVAHPQFSADGAMLAFAANVVGPNPIEFDASDLDVAAVDPATSTFLSRRTILSGSSDPNSDAIAFPSFTPDGKWLLYQRGNYSRANYGTGSIGHNDLFMVDVPASGAGTQIALNRLNGTGVLPPKELRRNYQPRVNPVAVGGYFWVVFVSPRDYGNRMASTDNASAQNRKQLWVAAIDANPQPGTDPSHPAFWLPGQDNGTINMDGYWAMEPCKQEGLACNEGYECCTGFCRDQGDGTFKCVPPPSNECHQEGEACKVDTDCCDYPKRKCLGGFCALQGPA